MHLYLQKLKSFGINGNLLTWLTCYLTNRKQWVTLDGAYIGMASSHFRCTPRIYSWNTVYFFFTLMTSPPYYSPDTLCAIFADDTKIHRQVSTANDAVALQHDIDNVIEWGTKWGLTFNLSKCCVLSVAGHLDPYIHNYTVANQPLPRVEQMNDLGVIVSSNLRWSHHIETVTRKAEMKLWMVIRALGFHAPQKAKLQAYQSLVRSNIEYCSVVWNPRFKHNLTDLEKVQRMATNFILNNRPFYSPNHINYKDRLVRLNLLPTSYRREILDIVFFLKCLHNKSEYNITDYVTFATQQGQIRTRGMEDGTRLNYPLLNLESSAHFYPYRLTKIWNSLPSDLRLTLKPVSAPLVMKQFLVPFYRQKLVVTFDPDDTCTWISWCSCYKCSL